MNDTAFNVEPKNYNRLMTHYEFDPINKKLHDPLARSQKIAGFGHPLNQLTYARGGHGLYSTLDDYSKFDDNELEERITIYDDGELYEELVENIQVSDLMKEVD